MLTDLRATPRLDGPCAVVEWTWRDDGERPALRLVRRRGTYPEEPDDGRAVLDLGELLGPGAVPWARVTRVRGLLDNSGAEGGLLEAELVLWFSGEADPGPSRARVAWYSPAAGETRAEDIGGLVGAEHSAEDGEETIALLVDDGGSPAETGRVVLENSPDGWLFTWQPTQGRAREVVFHRCEVEHTTARVAGSAARGLRARWRTWAEHVASPLAEALAGGAAPTVAGGGGVAAVTESGGAAVTGAAGADGRGRLRFEATLDEARDEDSGDWRRHLSVADRAVAPHIAAYYRLFAGGPDGHRSERDWRAWALPTPRYGSEDLLYRLLPSVHRQLDEPDGGGRGQLRRFLSVFGLGVDHLRGHAEGLEGRHDLLRATPDQLAQLSRWVGWEPDRTAPVRRQRSDVRFASAVYDTVGTAGNLRAVIKRAVGWESETKEFADNVALTNAPEPVRTWELWSARLAAGQWDEPEASTDSTAFDGRPAAVVDHDGALWLFWESDRTGRRTIWLRGPNHPDAPAFGADGETGGEATDEHPAAAVGPDGAVWLFWSSDRAGKRQIWRRRYTADGAGHPEQVTSHAAADAYPAVADDGDGGLWLFWQSARRGPTDIWCRRLPAGEEPGEERRATGSASRDEMPAAATDPSGRLWLFWVTDEAGGRSLRARTRDGDGWSEPQTLHAGRWRDEAPCAVAWDQQLWLLWHSDRDGHWNLWSSRHDGQEWTEPATVTAHVEADKEPAAVADSNALWVWWRSQRGGAGRRSRTLDTSDAAAMAAMGTLNDRVHYTYDTGRDPDDWYARDTVGVALKPTGDVADADAALERIADYVEPFSPLPVRLVWLSVPAQHEDVINTDDLIEEEHDVID